MVIHGHQLQWGGRSQRRSASLQVCSLNGTSTAFKRKSAFESSEFRQRATYLLARGFTDEKVADTDEASEPTDFDDLPCKGTKSLRKAVRENSQSVSETRPVA